MTWTRTRRVKTGEAAAGHRAWPRRCFPTDHPYRQRLDETRARFGAAAYPGSPLIAALGLRETDTMHLAELHPQEMRRAARRDRRRWGAHVRQRTGSSWRWRSAPPTPAPRADADRPVL